MHKQLLIDFQPEAEQPLVGKFPRPRVIGPLTIMAIKTSSMRISNEH